MNEETGLVLSSSFEAMKARRDAQVSACQYVDRVLREQPEGFPRLFFSDGREWDMARATRDAERAAWSELVTGTGLYTFMDATARREWAEHLDRGELPPFTEENARTFADDLHARRGAMVKRGVGDCFRRLSGHYATNKPDRFASRMILTHVLTVYGSGAPAWWTLNSRACDDLDDLVRVLRLCRGLVEPDHRRGSWYTMHEAGADSGSGGWPRVVEFDFFTIKLHKNGNGHLTFRHAEDVQRLNKILSMESDGLSLAGGERAKPRKRPPAANAAGDLSYFATSPALAAELVRRAGVTPTCQVLEPSAGTGAIAKAIVAAQGSAGRLTCVELHPGRALDCERDTGAKVERADFLMWTGGGQQFDCIVMNPPFSMPGCELLDIDHVMHAASMLAPGGRLVSVMSAGVTFRRNAKALEFRAWLDRNGGTIEQLPEGAFAESGTGVRTVVVTVDWNHTW